MAQNNFKIFDQNKVNMQSDTDYTNNTQRLNGVQQGIASSSLNNKALYQASTMNAAIAGFMNDNGQDATDTNLLTLKNNYSAALTNFSNGVNSVIESYPVKSGVTFSAGYPVDIENGEITTTTAEVDGFSVITPQTMDVTYQLDAAHLYTAKGKVVYQYTLTNGTFAQTALYTIPIDYDDARITSIGSVQSGSILIGVATAHGQISPYYFRVMALTVSQGAIAYATESEEIGTYSWYASNLVPFVGGTLLFSVGSSPYGTNKVVTYSGGNITLGISTDGGTPILLNNQTVLAVIRTPSSSTFATFYSVSSDGTLTFQNRNTDDNLIDSQYLANSFGTIDDKIAIISNDSNHPGHLYSVNYDTWRLTQGDETPVDPLLDFAFTCYPVTTLKKFYRASTASPYDLHVMQFSESVTYTDTITQNVTPIFPYTSYQRISTVTLFSSGSKDYFLYNYSLTSSDAVGFVVKSPIIASLSKDAIAMQDSTTSPCKVCFAGAVKIDGIDAGISVVTPGVSMQTYSDNRCIIYNSNAIPYQLLTFTGDGTGQRSINVGFVYKFIIEADTSKIVLGNSTMLYVPTNNVNGTTYTYIAFR